MPVDLPTLEIRDCFDGKPILQWQITENFLSVLFAESEDVVSHDCSQFPFLRVTHINHHHQSI